MAGRRITRKTTPKVRDGKVQRKNRWELPASYWSTPQNELVFDRERPGRAYKHLHRLDDVRRFIEVLPMWEELSEGLNAVVLARGEPNLFGWHVPGVVGLCAWERDIALEGMSTAFYRGSQRLLEKLGVPCWIEKDGWTLDFDVHTARAFQLVDVLVHELGHHHDRITSRRKRTCGRGESYAEDYVQRYEDDVLAVYATLFDL